MTFIVYSLPRSRSFWLSRYLSYSDWCCGHDEIRHARSLADVESWFTQPRTGTVETAGAPWWRLVQRIAPDVRTVVVRRPVNEVVESLMATGLPFDRARLTAGMTRLDHKLDQIEHRVPNVLSVSYASLASENVCALIFEHCLPFQHDPAWWRMFEAVNLQNNLLHLMRYMHAYRSQLDALTKIAKYSILADMLRKPPIVAGVTIRQESFDATFEAALDVMAQHCVHVGETPDNFRNKNIALMRQLDQQGALMMTTARDPEGRLLGYLMALLSPSLESSNIMTAQHLAFYTSPTARGLAPRLQRASVAALCERGVSEIYLRAGVRGSGHKLGALYRRMGAEPFGEMFKLELA